MPEDHDLELEVGEWAHRRRAPLAPEVLEQRREDFIDLRARLDRAIVAQSARLVDEYRFEHDERQL